MTGLPSTAPHWSAATGRGDEPRLVRWGLPAAIFLASRVVDTVLLWAGTGRQVQLTAANFPFFMGRDFPTHPGYLDVITTWDGQFYKAIALDGYLIARAADPQAAGREGTWLFPPGFPMTTRAAMWLTGGDFAVVATALNVVLGAVAMVVLYDLVRRSSGRYLAAAAVATTALFVSAPLMQTAYSESLAMLLLVLALRDIADARYARSAMWALLLSLTRIVTPPLLVVLLAHLWLRRREGARLEQGQTLGAVMLAGVCLAGPFLWSMVATALRPPGQGVSRAADVASGSVTWFGQAYGYWGPAGLAVMVLIAVSVLLMPLTRAGRAMGVELSTWLWAYPFFLFAVTSIQTGMLRYLLLAPGILVPLLGPFRNARVGRWVALTALVGLLVLAQRWFVDALIVIDSLDQGFGP